METQLNPRVRLYIAVLTALLLAVLYAANAYAASPAPAVCTRPIATTLHCELWARAGTYTPQGASGSLTVWGYTDAVTGTVTMPGGPAIVANQGDTVEVVLHNDLAGQTTSLALHGQGLGADTAGVGAGGSTTYTFLADQAGTFLYEAGLTANGPRQVAMGLYGALVVKPASAPATYTSENVLVLSEIDPELNAAPTTFDMRDYKPRYWLINGQSYPGTDALAVSENSTTRVRYINAGLNENSMALLGNTQQVIAQDGYAVPAPYRVVAETIPPGGTLDVLVTVGASGAQYAVYSAAQHLDNDGAAYGGQLLYLNSVIVVTNPDVAPTVNAGVDQTITLPASAIFDGTVTDDGVSALTTTWSVTSGPITGTVTFGDASQVDTTATFSVDGVYVLRLTATDGTGPVFDEVQITVNAASPVDQPPTVNAGVDQTITLPASATLDGTVTDDGLSVITTTWSMTSDPGTVTFGDASQVDTTASFSVDGVYVLRLTATDGTGPVFDEVQITVNVAPPPASFPATGVLDNFDRADGPIGSNWSGDTGGYATVSNALDVGLTQEIFWNPTAYGANQEVYVTLTTIDTGSSTEMNLLLKAQSASSGAATLEIVYLPNTGVAQVWTFDGATWVQYGADIPLALANGDQFGARALADGTVTIYKNGVAVGTRNVSAWAYASSGGYIGLWNVTASSAVLDNFGGGTVP